MGTTAENGVIKVRVLVLRHQNWLVPDDPVLLLTIVRIVRCPAPAKVCSQYRRCTNLQVSIRARPCNRAPLVL